ncbi:MAG: EscU/YscU/HrcU family type III secretion system export apparatus switch protein [Candidatus Sericytochromatia bacterium]
MDAEADQNNVPGALPVKQATALKYDVQSASQAPEVVATGSGEIAEEIVRVAEEHAVPVYHDPSLAKALGQLELGSMVPPELYKAVAEVLVFVYSLDQAHKKQIEMVLEEF